jgi:hypothetical protein
LLQETLPCPAALLGMAWRSAPTHTGENGEIGARHHLRVARRGDVGAEALAGQDDRAHVVGAELADATLTAIGLRFVKPFY